jgi:hypothetical protein
MEEEQFETEVGAVGPETVGMRRLEVGWEIGEIVRLLANIVF